MGSLTLASREKLDNLTWIINCRLAAAGRAGARQRQGDSGSWKPPSVARAGTSIKVIWAKIGTRCWARDHTGLLQSAWVKRWMGVPDLHHQRRRLHSQRTSSASTPSCSTWWRTSATKDPEPVAARGPRFRAKVYNAYRAAGGNQKNDRSHRDPGRIPSRATGWERRARAATSPHQQKKLNEQELEAFPDRLRVHIRKKPSRQRRILRPPSDSPGNGLPARAAAPAGWIHARGPRPRPPASKLRRSITLKESLEGSSGREVSSTMAFVRVLTLLMKHPGMGHRVVPIIPDEARTVRHGIPVPPIRQSMPARDKLYKPHDAEMFLYYKESKGARFWRGHHRKPVPWLSFTAAGTAYAN